ncbi:Uu.00g049820.m01.CDS01 [Anthostomella pinea]|uniref:Uu.00g049820.m01.CDS01 n=1 Tax=Anthostomella pinea TaxID=933095 RepID=A0AAI8VC01_9PEZI|nr:Uu.00g049820.m01.CDS01 [Anthostomella pinea]
MLLLHQVGSIKIGEVIRYTVTYTPSHDRILPSPNILHLRVRNTSPLPLRAAFVHGPYTLNVSAYPSHYDPNTKFEDPRRYGVPEFEPMLKAAGTWSCQLIVPDNIQQSAGMGAARGDFGYGAEEGEEPTSASWIIEIASQVIFSSSAAVGYEVLLARDEKSLNLGSTPVNRGQSQVPQPGRVVDFQQSIGSKDGHHPAQLKGVFSKAITLKVEDTASLWNTPQLPGWDDWDHGRSEGSDDPAINSVTSPASPEGGRSSSKNPKKVHLVVLTHGLHSNLGADMLYLKESIDASVKQARTDAKVRRAREKAERDANKTDGQADRDANGTDNPEKTTEERTRETAESRTEEDEEEYEDEEVIVRGFSGNATRTERGIKFLGKRLARYVLSMTYPDQPFLPSTKKAAESFATSMKGNGGKTDGNGQSAHRHSTIHKGPHHEENRLFQITSISFVGHSLGGLVQTYAVAYIQKHSPQFFNLIRPLNFITLASPLLGLSNENPLYVKFALDFGLVGRTGQDLGLTWRAPTIARSGWGALVGTLGESAHKKVMGEEQPESKPLLRILPTGPAHTALKKFRNRTVYSNVVNDGIVPLRTSCLLFLDWQGLGRVDKARREAGLMETMVGFGWAELTGANVTSARKGPWTPDTEEAPSQPGANPEPEATHESREVPLPPSNATAEDDRRSLNLTTSSQEAAPHQNSQTNNDYPFSGFFNFFKSNESSKAATEKTSQRSPKGSKIYKRSQTLKIDDASADSASSSKSKVSSGNELHEDQESGVSAPPRTSFFEAAGDILNPKLPTMEYILDPSRRPRTIFHDRVYHPSDIPPPPLKKRPTGTLAIRRRGTSQNQSLSPKGENDETSSQSSQFGVKHEDSGLSTRDYDDIKHTDPDRDPEEMIDTSNMKVEEKIARAYHRDLSWRKVLVKLEPDAHNNIIVRRTFANAFGWPVVKHLVDAHFSDSAAARTRDENEDNIDRAKAMYKSPDTTGAETGTQHDAQPHSGTVGLDTGGNMDAQTEDDAHHTVPIKSQPLKLRDQGRTNSEVLEAVDAVPDLPTADQKSRASHSSRESPPRPGYDRLDSATWSDRDFADSGDDSEVDMEMAYGRYSQKPQTSAGDKGKETERSSSPVWNWTEKIVGKGPSKKGKGPQSPTSPGPGSGHSPGGAGGIQQ